jgi:hypothetical protein
MLLNPCSLCAHYQEQIEDLKRLVRSAYREGYTDTTPNFDSDKLEKLWQESTIKSMLEGFLDNGTTTSS